jgi:hypothetical protein
MCYFPDKLTDIRQHEMYFDSSKFSFFLNQKELWGENEHFQLESGLGHLRRTWHRLGYGPLT